MGNKGKTKGILIFFILLALLVGMVLVGAEIFQIQKITVLGNEKMVYNEIIRLSGISYGDNIFKLDKRLIIKRLQSNPYIEVLSITPRYPDEVTVQIRERTPAAVVPYLGSYIVIDQNGIILEIRKDLGALDYPIVQDLNVQSFILGKELVVGDTFQMKVLSRLLEGIYSQGVKDEISEILLKDTNDIYLISKSGMLIRMGQAIEVKDKLRWLGLKEFLGNNDDEKKVFDISVASKPVIRTFKAEVNP